MRAVTARVMTVLTMRALGVMGVVRSMRTVTACVMTFRATKEQHVSFAAFSVQVNNECTLPTGAPFSAVLAPFARLIFAFPGANHLQHHVPAITPSGSFLQRPHAENVTTLFAIAHAHLSTEASPGAGFAFFGIHIDMDLDLAMEIAEQFANLQLDGLLLQSIHTSPAQSTHETFMITSRPTDPAGLRVARPLDPDFRVYIIRRAMEPQISAFDDSLDLDFRAISMPFFIFDPDATVFGVVTVVAAAQAPDTHALATCLARFNFLFELSNLLEDAACLGFLLFNFRRTVALDPGLVGVSLDNHRYHGHRNPGSRLFGLFTGQTDVRPSCKGHGVTEALAFSCAAHNYL